MILLVFVALLSVVSSSPYQGRNLEEDIDWANNNATQLTKDLIEFRASLFAYFEQMSVQSSKDFNQIKLLMNDLQADPTEISRLDDLLNAILSEVRLMLENHLLQSQDMEFQNIRIKASLSIQIDQLATDRHILEENLSKLMADLMTTRLVVDTMYANVHETIVELIKGQSGSKVDEIMSLLDKVQTDLGIKTAVVQEKASKATNTCNELGSILDWILAQLPGVKINK